MRNSSRVKFIISLVYFIAQIKLFKAQEPCTFKNTPFPKEYVFQTTSSVSQQIKAQYYLNSTQNPLGQPFLYILRNSGQQSIIDLSTSSILNSFSISNLDILTSSWSFGVQQTILYHILDKSGNVYEVDGSYGSQLNYFEKPTSDSLTIPIASSPCISFKNSVYVTFSGNQLYFIYYRLPKSSSNRITIIDLSKLGSTLQVQGCVIQKSDLDNVVIFSQNPISSLKFSLANPTLPSNFEFKLDKITASLAFYGARQNYRYYSYTPDSKNYLIVVSQNGIQVGSSYSQTTNYVVINLDATYGRLIFTDTTQKGSIINISDSSLVRSFTFTETSIDFSESNLPTIDSSGQLSYVQSLQINQIKIYQENSQDYLIFKGGQTFFVFKYSTFAPVLFKDISLASNLNLDFILYNDQIIAVGDIQVTFVSIQKSKIGQLNFNGVNLITDNNQVQQSEIDLTNDRVLTATIANQLMINQLSTLTFEKMLSTSTLSGLRFQIILPSNKLLIYYLLNGLNSGVTDSRKFEVQVYDYKAVTFLYKFNIASSSQIMQLLYDQNTQDCFFVLNQSGNVIHRRFDTTSLASPLGTYNIASQTPASSSSSFLMTDFKRLVVQTTSTIYVFDYSDPINNFKSTAIYTFPLAVTLSTYVLQKSAIFAYYATANFAVFNTDTGTSSVKSIQGVNSVDAVFAADKSDNTKVVFGYTILTQYTVCIYNIQTQAIQVSQNLATNQQGQNIVLDSTLSYVVIVGTQGQFFVLNYADALFSILYKPNYYVGTVSYSLIDQTNQIANIFYSDFTYVKIYYKTGSLIKIQSTQQQVFKALIHPDSQTITLVLYYSHLNYREQQAFLQSVNLNNVPSQFEVDINRNLFYYYSNQTLLVYSLWQQNKLLTSKLVIPIAEQVKNRFIFDIKYSKKMNAIFFITTSGTSIYHMTYADFSYVGSYSTTYTDVSITNAAITIDDNLNRIFVSSAKGSWCYFTYDYTTNKLVKPVMYQGSLATISSPVNAIALDISKNLILITSNGYQSQLLYYDTLSVAVYSIPGHQGAFVKDINYFYMYTITQDGFIWIYNSQTFKEVWSQKLNAVSFSYVSVFLEPQYSLPSLLACGIDKILYYIPNLNASNMKTYQHDTAFKAGLKPLAVAFLDYHSKIFVTCDSKASVQVFSLPSLTLKYQYQAPVSSASTSSYQISFIKETNTIIYLASNNQISYVDLYGVQNSEFSNNYQGYYGISDMIIKNKNAFTTDALGLIQVWSQTLNQQTYIAYQKRGYFEYTKGQLKAITNTSLALGLYQKQILKLDLSTSSVVSSLSLNYCAINQYLPSANLIICIFNNVAALYNTDLNLIYTYTLTTPTSQTIIDVQAVDSFKHIIFTQTSGDFQIYTYDTFQPVYNIVPPSSPSGQITIVNKIIDAQNNLIILAYSNGSIQKFSYQQASITNQETLTLYPISQDGLQITILQIVNTNYLLVKRVNENFVQVLNYPLLTLFRYSSTTDNIFDSDPKRLGILLSPCTGPDSQIIENKSFSYFGIICSGQYNFYSSNDFSFIGSLRQLYNITSTFSNFQTQKASKFTYINQNYFIHSFYQSLFIFYIDPTQKILKYLGLYQNNDSVQYIGDFSAINKSDNSGIYGIQLTVYSFIAMEQIIIPLVSIDTCQFTTSAQLFAGSLTNLESTYKQMKLFSEVKTFRLMIRLTDSINLPLFPSFSFSSQTQLVFTPVGVDSPPSTDAQKQTRIKVFGSTQFFLSASQYNQLVMNNLNLIFIVNPLQSPLQILTLPLVSVQLLYIDIDSNVPSQQISFQSIQSVTLKQISINYKPAASRLLQGKRMLQTSSSYTQSSFIQFSDIINIFIQGVTIKGQTLTDLTLFDIRNNGEDFSQNPNLSLSSVTLDTFTIQDNTIVSSIPQNLQLSQVNSIINLSLIPTVKIQNFIVSGNESGQDNIQGIINLQAIKDFQASFCQFTSNKNMYLFQTNTTYAYYSASSSSSSSFNTKKYYQLQGCSVTFNSITMTSNTYNWYLRTLIQINSETFNGNSIYAYTNKLVDRVSSGLASQAAIINFISVINIKLSDVIFNQNTNFQNGLLKISNSAKVEIDGLNFNLNTLQSGALYLSYIESLTLSNSNFQDNQSNIQGCSIFSQSSNIKLNTVTFINERSLSNGGSIYMSSSTANLQQCTFSKISAQLQGGAIYADTCTLTIVKSTFTKCSSIGEGGSIYVSKTQLNLDSTTITGSVSQSQGGAISAASQSIINFVQSQFISNTAKNGGALYLLNSTPSSIIEDSSFSYNTAFGSGGGIMLDSSDIQVQQTRFMHNIAGYGGAMRYIGLVPTFLHQLLPSDLRATKDSNNFWIIKGNYYQNNTGYILGPDIGSLFTIISPSISTKNFNFETIFPDDPSEKNYPTDKLVYQYRFSSFRSGEANFQFNIVLYDTLSQSINPQYSQILPSGYKLSQEILDEINNINVKVQEFNSTVKIEDQTISIDGSTIVDYKQSKNDKFYGIQLDSISISGVPGSSGSFCLSFSGLNRISDTLYFVHSECINFYVEFRNCVIGEVYLPRCSNCLINQCDICQNGTYSLVEPKINSGLQCKPCQTQFTTNCYADQMTLLSGYWRDSLFSDEFFECSSKYKSCNGNQTSNYCEEGFIGALCQSCDQTGAFWGIRYGITSLYSKLTCQKCSEMTSQITSQIIFLAFTGLYIFFQIYSNIQSSINYIKGQIIKQLNMYMVQNSLIKYELSVLSKFLIHYMTVQEIINQLTISNKDFSEQVYSVPKELLIPVQNLFFGFDCYLSDPSSAFSSYPIEYARLLFTFVQCAFLLGLVVIFYAIFLLVGILQKQNLNYLISLYLVPSPLISSALFLMYFFQQTLTSTSLQVITCQTVGTDYYMASQMNKKCYTSEYFRWFPLLIITFAFSTIVYPLIIFIILYRNQHKIHNSSDIAQQKLLNKIQKEQSIRDPSKIIGQEAQKFDFNTSIRSQNPNANSNNLNPDRKIKIESFYYKTYRRYGFLYFEFKPQYWWWEIMKMTMRQAIIILTQLSLFQILEKVALIILILFLYQLLQLKIQPYRNTKLNSADLMLNALSIIIIILSLYSQGISNNTHKEILSIVIIGLKFFVLGFIILRLIESFTAQQLLNIKNSKALCIFKLLGEFFREEIFFRKNGSMRRNFPSLYLLMHKPELIGIDKHYRWKLIQIHINDFRQERRNNSNNVDFFQVAQSKNSKLLEDSQDIKSKYRYLKSYAKSQMKESMNQPTNTPKTSQFRNNQFKNNFSNSPIQSGRANNILKYMQQQHSLVDQQDLGDQTNINTPGATSKFQSTSRQYQDEQEGSKNQFYSSEGFQGKFSELQLVGKPRQNVEEQNASKSNSNQFINKFQIQLSETKNLDHHNFSQASQTMTKVITQDQEKQKSLCVDNETEVSDPGIFVDQNERQSNENHNKAQSNYFEEYDAKGHKV